MSLQNRSTLCVNVCEDQQYNNKAVAEIEIGRESEKNKIQFLATTDRHHHAKK
jgi:hypothetical protein